MVIYGILALQHTSEEYRQRVGLVDLCSSSSAFFDITAAHGLDFLVNVNNGDVVAGRAAAHADCHH